MLNFLVEKSEPLPQMLFFTFYDMANLFPMHFFYIENAFFIINLETPIQYSLTL